MSEKIQDYRTTQIGRENWEVCSRMLVHDLIDMAEKVPAVASLLKFYGIGYHESGGYTMALPRLYVLMGTKALDVKQKAKKK